MSSLEKINLTQKELEENFRNCNLNMKNIKENLNAFRELEGKKLVVKDKRLGWKKGILCGVKQRVLLYSLGSPEYINSKIPLLYTNLESVYLAL